MATPAVVLSTQLSGTQVTAHYVDIGDQGESRLLAVDGGGNLFVVSTVIEPWGQPQIRVTKTDPNGNPLAVLDFGGSNLQQVPDALSGAATDPQGNLVIAGTTSSADFPSVNPLFSTTGQNTAFVVKLDSQLSHIQFSIRLGGSRTSPPNGSAQTSAGAVAVDRSGNIFLAGTTDAIDFPVTKNAFRTSPPQPSMWGTPFYGFVTEISADGTQLVSSTYFGADGYSCRASRESPQCFPVGTGVSAIRLDSNGSIVIAGPTNAPLPITPGAYMEQCTTCGSFLAKLSADSSSLLWATFLAPSPSSTSGLSISTMALDADGSVIAGGSSPEGLSVTPGTLQASFPGHSPAAGFVAKLDSLGQHLVFATYLGSNTPVTDPSITNVKSLVVGAQGTIWVTGGSDPSMLPLPSGTASLGPLYTIGLSADGTRLTSATTAPLGASGMAVLATTQGAIVTLGEAGSILIAASGHGPSLLGVANSAAHYVSGFVAPLELVSFYGDGLGPANPLSAQVVDNGSIRLVSSSLGGIQVFFDGIAAPLLYVGPQQINAIVPWEVYGRQSTTVQIVTPGGNLTGLTFLTKLSQPQVFRYPGTQFALALNEDGTANSASNAAVAGSIVSIWATGGGITWPGAQPDGQIIPSPLGPLLAPRLSISVLGPDTSVSGSGRDALEVLYGGDANAMVQGVIQVNFRLPAINGTVLQLSGAELQIGGSASEPFLIHVK